MQKRRYNVRRISASELMFTPPEGAAEYKREDYKILCKSTPIPIYKIPSNLLFKQYRPGWRRPTLWCGWAVGEEKLLELVQTNYPHRVLRNNSSKTVQRLNTVMELPSIINEEFKVPEKFRERVMVTEVWNSQGEMCLALVVGNNFMNIIGKGEIALISKAFFDGEPPGWSLCTARWRWTRQPMTVAERKLRRTQFL
ncbi:hypothetical protein EYR40_010741 [Pleurotus pulmonarius]|nr:hypothetical protein EYR36_002512 [Pleurotus pulmonarius]KAF4586726.1 hypothetical protein EYR40_010741 [Pleurotus pulmonarius]